MKPRSPLAMIVVLLVALGLAGCGENDHAFLQNLQGEWTTVDAGGASQRVTIDERHFRFSAGTEDEIAAAYTSSWFQEADGTMGLKIFSKAWTGSPEPVDFRIRFEEDASRFELSLNGRAVSEFTRVDH